MTDHESTWLAAIEARLRRTLWEHDAVIQWLLDGGVRLEDLQTYEVVDRVRGRTRWVGPRDLPAFNEARFLKLPDVTPRA